MNRKQSIIDAVNAGDFRRAARLSMDAAVPKGSREFDDVCGTVERTFSKAGRHCPRLRINHKSDVQRAVIGVDEFMSNYGIALTSINRTLAVQLVCEQVIAVIGILPDDLDSEQARDHFAVPPYVRALQLLASPVRAAAAISQQFPGYLGSRLASMIGFSCDAVNNFGNS